MGQDAGVSGFFGVLLNARKEPEVKKLVEDIDEWVRQKVDGSDDDEDDLGDPCWNISEHEDEINKKFFDRTMSVLNSIGIVVPEEAYLMHTGDDYDRPCRVQTWGDQWGIGFGILTWPWNYPEFDESFKKAGDWHTWVWMG